MNPQRKFMNDRLLPVTIVGSYPQPDWLIDRARLSKMVPRVLVGIRMPATGGMLRDQPARSLSTSMNKASRAAR